MAALAADLGVRRTGMLRTGAQMSTGVSAWLEVPDDHGGTTYRTFGQLWWRQLEGLDVYALTGLEGRDPTYRVEDLSWGASERWRIELADVATTQILKIEAHEALALVDMYLAKHKHLNRYVEETLRFLPRLHERARLVFWMRN